MKRILSAILVFCLLLALAGCATKEYTLVEEKLVSSWDSVYGAVTPEEVVELFNGILRRANNSRRAADIVTKQYQLSLMQECASLVSHIGYSSYGHYFISSTNLDIWFTVEAIRKVNDTLYYVVYKIKEGGWLYLFLEVDPFTHEYYPETVLHAAITHSIYIKEKANKKALAAIGEGSSFADVCAADPSAALAREYEINPCYKYKWVKKHSLHWVDNEVFVFTYDETGETVTGVEHYPDGRVPCEGSDFVFDYNLLPIDCKCPP